MNPTKTSNQKACQQKRQLAATQGQISTDSTKKFISKNVYWDIRLVPRTKQEHVRRSEWRAIKLKKKEMKKKKIK